MSGTVPEDMLQYLDYPIPEVELYETGEVPEGMVRLRGRLVVVGPDGSEHSGTDGRLEVSIERGESLEMHDVVVTNGSWIFDVPRDAKVAFSDGELGGRIAARRPLE